MFTSTRKHSIGILLVLSTPVTLAQVVLDGTLGKPGNLAGPTFAISADLGQQHGSNLFHSFQTFNLQSGETATFSGPDTVTNVISRVTGGQSSYLNGTLQLTIPQANFYFLNPAGVMFGPGAKLDVPGSFHVSTANYLRLEDNGRFDASEPARSVLTVAPPAAFGFLTESPGKIASEKSFLTVPHGQKLSWIGGDLTILNSRLAVGKEEKTADGKVGWSPGGGGINLVSVAAAGEVPVIPEELAEGKFGKFGHISITDNTVGKANQSRSVANVDASGVGGGKIYIRGGQITLDNGYVFADTWGNQAGQGIEVKAQEKLTMQNGARITTETPERAVKGNTGNAGPIQIQARQLSLSGGSQIVSSTNTAGAAGDVTVTAAESIEASGKTAWGPYDSGIQSKSLQAGKGGQVNMSAPLITLNNGGVILTSTQGLGDAGNVTVQADKLVLESGGHISVSAKPAADDKDFNKTGNAGNISITAGQSVFISGRPTLKNPSGLRSNVYTAGKGGEITVNTPVLTVQDGGSIQSGTEWRGDGGQIVLNTSQLTVRRGGIITAESMLSQSERVPNETEKESEDFYKVCDSQWCGKAGNITIHTDYLTLQQGDIKTAAYLSGGGDICLHVNQRLYASSDSEISAMARGIREGDKGGNLTIKQPTFVILGEQSKLNTSAYAGFGGNITVVADNYIKSADKVVIDASSEKNLPGEISIAATQEDFIGLLSFSPKRYSTTTKLVRHSCGRGKKKNQYQNTFQVILQEMLHPAPSDLRFFSPVE
jgi:filamentous hemagglutinin family protein